jgi:uncharacterized membrane protein (DUF485 family)
MRRRAQRGTRMSSTRDRDDPPTPKATTREEFYLTVWRSQEFRELRRRFRRFVIPVTVVSLLWYFLYVFLAAYAPGFMGRSVAGPVTVGLIMGLLQFVSTFGVTALYVRYADRVLDPLASRIRERMEAGGLE